MCQLGLLKSIVSDVLGCFGFRSRYTDDEEPIYKADLESLGTYVHLIHLVVNDLT